MRTSTFAFTLLVVSKWPTNSLSTHGVFQFLMRKAVSSYAEPKRLHAVRQVNFGLLTKVYTEILQVLKLCTVTIPK